MLTDAQRRDLVASAYAISPAFGLYVEVHAATGARTSQIALLDVDDLHAGKEPKLMVPSISQGQESPRAHAQADADRAELGDAAEAGRSWTRCRRAAAADEGRPALDLRPASHPLPQSRRSRPACPTHATMYCLRHTAITKALLAGVPVRLVAASFDTTVAMIEKTYSQVHR